MTDKWAECAFLGNGLVFVWGEGEGGYFEVKLDEADSERVGNLAARHEQEMRDALLSLGEAAFVSAG